MWYVVQTPVGREAEAAEKLNHFYRDKAEKPCFVLSKERTWRMGGVYYVDTEVMFPGYVFVDTADEPVLEDGVKCLAGLVRFLNAGSEAHPYGTAVPLKKRGREISEKNFFGRILHTVRRFLVRGKWTRGRSNGRKGCLVRCCQRSSGSGCETNRDDSGRTAERSTTGRAGNPDGR